MLLDYLLLDLPGHRLMATHERGKQPLGLAADRALETINRDWIGFNGGVDGAGIVAVVVLFAICSAERALAGPVFFRTAC
jgi:hypothetical protein